MEIKVIFLVLGILLFIPMVHSTCTVTFDKSVNYTQGETVTAQMSCSEATEKNKDYSLIWTNTSNFTIETDTGTTPSTIGQNFFEIFVIPSDYIAVNGTNISAFLTGTNLEGLDVESIDVAGTNDLIITEIGFTSPNEIRIGKTFGIEFEVDDENSKGISNAQCEIDLEDGLGNPLMSKEIITHAGKGDVEFLLQSETFVEDRGYLVAIRCFCGLNSTSLACIDEDGTTVVNSVGSVDSAFDIVKWLTINTVVDKTEYYLRNTIFICANVSNNHTRRVSLHIFHQVRCSRGSDNDDDLDRSLVITDGFDYDERGIDANSTQMQCKEFLIPELRHLEGNTNECYATTSVWVMNERNEKIKLYPTTSSVFNITSDTLNLPVDWANLSENKFLSVVNLSSSFYKDWNGTGIGNIDLFLSSMKGESFDPKTTRVTPQIDFDSFLSSRQIKEIIVWNKTQQLSYTLEFLEDGHLEIELRDVDISQDGWYNVTLEFEDFEERQTNYLNRSATALEGIENKTGTFHFSVDCPAEAIIGETMQCSIIAQIEDPQLVQKEVDFTCYISDGTNNYSSLNFNQMVTKEQISLERTFLVTNDLNQNQEYILQCHGDYYNLGSRRDSFYDTFMAKESVGGEGLISTIIEKIKDVIEEILGIEDEDEEVGEEGMSIEVKILLGAVIGIIILTAIILIASIKRKSKKEIK